MIMFHHDGWRTLYATHPLLAMMFALGFANPLAVATQQPPIRPSRVIAFSAILSLAFIGAPAVVKLLGETAAPAPVAGQRFVHGGAMTTGFVIVPDGTPPLTDAPSLPALTFVALMKRTFNMESDWGPFSEDIVSRAPIALMWSPELKNTGKSGGLYSLRPKYCAAAMSAHGGYIWRHRRGKIGARRSTLSSAPSRSRSRHSATQSLHAGGAFDSVNRKRHLLRLGSKVRSNCRGKMRVLASPQKKPREEEATGC